MVAMTVLPQVFNNVEKGRMVAMECDLTMDAPAMKVVVTGTGPLGRFTATVSAVKMTGRSQ
jgi:hypothetical protein